MQRTIIKIALRWLLPLHMKWDIIWVCHMIIKTVNAPLTMAALCKIALGEANAYIYTMAEDISNCSLTLAQNLNFLSYSSNRYIYPDSFSTCSQSSLRTFLQNYDSSCLLDVPNDGELYGGPVCGNAFVEKGEECDCGTVEVWHVGFEIQVNSVSQWRLNITKIEVCIWVAYNIYTIVQKFEVGKNFFYVFDIFKCFIEYSKTFQ